MSRRSVLDHGIATGLRLTRTTTDRALSTARPVVERVLGGVASRLRRAPAPRPTTTAFVPSKKRPTGPTPASVAQNIAPKRPSAAPAKPAKKAPPRSAPGAKLPPPRPSAS